MPTPPTTGHAGVIPNVPGSQPVLLMLDALRGSVRQPTYVTHARPCIATAAASLGTELWTAPMCLQAHLTSKINLIISGQSLEGLLPWQAASA